FGGRERDQRRERTGLDFRVVLEDEGEIERLVEDPPPGGAMAEKSADLRPRQRERIARLKAAAHISPVEHLLRQLGAVHRRDDLGLNRKALDERPDIGPARNGAIQVENEGLRRGQGWLTGQRPAIVREGRAPSYAPILPKSSRRASDLFTVASPG